MERLNNPTSSKPVSSNLPLHTVEDNLRIVLAHRSVPVARLAEAASLGAATHDLHSQAVLDDIGIGHDHRLRLVLAVELVDPNALYRERGAVVNRLPAGRLVSGRVVPSIKGGDVDTGDCGQSAQDLLTSRICGATVAYGIEDLVERSLAVADQDGIEEVGHRLRVCRARDRRR